MPTPPSLNEQLRFAIDNKRLLQLKYNDRVRVVEPHDYGVHNGTTRVLVYQRQGSDGDPTSKGWRLLDVRKIGACVVLDETFRGSRGAAHEDHYAWEILYARVT